MRQPELHVSGRARFCLAKLPIAKLNPRAHEIQLVLVQFGERASNELIRRGASSIQLASLRQTESWPSAELGRPTMVLRLKSQASWPPYPRGQ